MKVRTLPCDEWAGLDDTGLNVILSGMFPRDARVVVVEDDAGKIAARMAVLQIPHLEAFWISKDAYGNAGITRALLRACMREAESFGQSYVYANADNGAMGSTLARLGGVRMPIETYLLPLRAERET